MRYNIRELMLWITIIAVVLGWAADRLITERRMRELRYEKEFAERMWKGRFDLQTGG